MDLLVDGATGLAGRQALVGSSARVPRLLVVSSYLLLY